MNINDYYLDLNMVSSINTEFDKEMIYQYYTSMLHFDVDGQKSACQSIFNTLFTAGYLKSTTIENREKKLDIILG